MDGRRTIIGIDEVGRGAWAGPLVASAVYIVEPSLFPFETVKDSKLLTDAERRVLLPLLFASCRVAYGMVSHRLIDRIGLQAANVLAMDAALRTFPRTYFVRADYVGGFHRYMSSLQNITLYKHGESRYPEIAAASVLAKVYRDDLMRRFDSQLPGYGFARHKGYVTAAHRQAVQRYGLSDIHRRSFVFRLP